MAFWRIVQRRRDAALLIDHIVMAQAVELFGGDAGLHIGVMWSSASLASRPATRILAMSSAFLMMIGIENGYESKIIYHLSKKQAPVVTCLAGVLRPAWRAHARLRIRT